MAEAIPEVKPGSTGPGVRGKTVVVMPALNAAKTLELTSDRSRATSWTR